MEIYTIGIDPGKTIFHLVGLNGRGEVLRFAAQHNYDGFYQKEMEFQKWLRYPPLLR